MKKLGYWLKSTGTKKGLWYLVRLGCYLIKLAEKKQHI